MESCFNKNDCTDGLLLLLLCDKVCYSCFLLIIIITAMMVCYCNVVLMELVVVLLL